MRAANAKNRQGELSIACAEIDKSEEPSEGAVGGHVECYTYRNRQTKNEKIEFF